MLRSRAPISCIAVLIAGACFAISGVGRFHQPRIKDVDVVPHEVVGGSTTDVTGLVTIDQPAPTGGVTITLASSDTSTVSVPASVTIPAGDTSATFAVTTTQVTKDEYVKITAGLNGEHRDSHLRLKRFDVESFSFNPSTIKGGTVFTGFQTTVGTVLISAPAGPNGVVVQLTSDSAGTTLNSSVTIPAGETSVNFSLVASSVTKKTVFHITASIGCSQKTTKLTVVPD
jgi:hypothetical protein